MSRVFAYCRVSTADQTTDNQIQEIAAAGFTVQKGRVIAETVSGSVPAMKRKGFLALLNKLEAADVLIVTKLDRLGRNAMDVRASVERLASIGVRVHCLALGGVDLTSPAGKMTMGLSVTCLLSVLNPAWLEPKRRARYWGGLAASMLRPAGLSWGD